MLTLFKLFPDDSRYSIPFWKSLLMIFCCRVDSVLVCAEQLSDNGEYLIATLGTNAVVPSRYSRVRWFVWSTKMIKKKKLKKLVLVKKLTGKSSVYVRRLRFLLTPFIAFLWYYRNFIPTILLIRRFKGTQDREFFWLRFWNLRYFFDSYVKILRLY